MASPTGPAVSAAPEMTIRKAANLLRGRSIGCLPVMDEGRLVGIITFQNLMHSMRLLAESRKLKRIAEAES